MDLSQTKLTKTEWATTEIPVNEDEKRILQMIIDGYHNVNIRTNVNASLFQLMKIEYTPENEAFLYKKYFEKDIQSMIEKHKKRLVTLEYKNKDLITKPPKRVDVLRMENMDKNMENKLSQDIFEYVLLDFGKQLLKLFSENSKRYAFYLYTLLQMKKSTILHTNKYVLAFIDYLIGVFTESSFACGGKPTEHEVRRRECSEYIAGGHSKATLSNILTQSYEFIEKNPYLLKYEDMTLFQHQKQLFSILKHEPTLPKLILYIAPTGTGKTLSPLGISEQYRVIFICVARHVGLALAKSAISVGKKIAFAFGCETASDIRLHYFAASNYTVNKRSGSIAKVDNSMGDRVEIMICDVQSYLTAMHYMLAFNRETDIVTYWDEPTITMDYPTHELHQKIHENWKQNKISKMVLSCATLPKESEIQETLADFRNRFDMAEVHMIESYDCKKSISILNKEGYCVLPHTITVSHDYQNLMKTIGYCEENKTLLRYFDLSEIIRYIETVHGIPGMLPEECQMDAYFGNISEITMNSIKLYYLFTFRHLNADQWPDVHKLLIETQQAKYPAVPVKSDPIHGGELRKIQSVQVTSPPSGREMQKMSSLGNKITASASHGILLTTADAHTLTDGPTIFIAEDIEKIGKFYIQSSKIPTTVLDRILVKIEKNNEVQQHMDGLQQKLEDKMGANKPSFDPDPKSASTSKKDRKDARREEMDPEIARLVQQIDALRSQIQTVNLDAVYVPNSPSHQMTWAGQRYESAYMPNIEDAVVKEIMELAVDNSMKILLLLGIGMFVNNPNPGYMEIMKRLAYEQKLYLIIASSDYIYGTNYSFCHGFIGKDLTNMTQQKIIQAMGRVGRNKIQQEYTLRFRDNTIMNSIFLPQTENMEAVNMCRLFSSCGE